MKEIDQNIVMTLYVNRTSAETVKSLAGRAAEWTDEAGGGAEVTGGVKSRSLAESAEVHDEVICQDRCLAGARAVSLGYIVGSGEPVFGFESPDWEGVKYVSIYDISLRLTSDILRQSFPEVGGTRKARERKPEPEREPAASAPSAEVPGRAESAAEFAREHRMMKQAQLQGERKETPAEAPAPEAGAPKARRVVYTGVRREATDDVFRKG